jgi:hypothetical protein
VFIERILTCCLSMYNTYSTRNVPEATASQFGADSVCSAATLIVIDLSRSYA